MKTLFNEDNTMEQMVISILIEKGWTYIPAEDLPRMYSDVMVEPMVKEALIRSNPEIAAEPSRADETIYKLRTVILSVQPHNLVTQNESFKKLVFEENSFPFGKDGRMVPIRFFGTMRKKDIAFFTMFASDKKYRKYKIICCYQQFEGANMIVSRVLAGYPKKGLIWHFQGSGKSLLMVFAAQKLRMIPELKNPTVVIVDDRIDLETQITATFNASDIPNLTSAATKEELSSFFRGDMRKILITTIFKFGEVNKVCEHIARHFRSKIEPNGYKGQIVVYDRECCLMYKAVLDELLGEDATTIVMDTNNDKEDRYKKYRRDRDAERKILDVFRDPNSALKLVIVTSKLLTGFDAPILQAMYLDKPMKDHTLLQAICRTNRTYDQGKTHGSIVDYIGIFDDAAKALDFDETSMRQIITNIEEIKNSCRC